MHQVEVDVQRLGGGFGGKEDQANAWAAICAVGTQLTKRPVKYALHRMEDMRMTGKRHPYSSDYKIGLDKDLKIVAYEVTFYQNAGASCRPFAAGARTHAVSLHKFLFHPERHRDRLLLPHESAAEHGVSRLRRAAGNVRHRIGDRARGGKLGVSAAEIQRKNLIDDGDEFPYGQKAESDAITSLDAGRREIRFCETAKRSRRIQRNNQISSKKASR